MKKRDLNVDLLRILATIFVIVLHVLGEGGVLQKASPDKITYWAAWFLEIGAFCAVNCFALISGYIMLDKTVKPKNIIGLWFQVLFYSLLFTAFFFIFLPESRTTENLVAAFLPILGKQWWYVSSYFALFFFIPFLNQAIHHVSQRTYKKFLIVIFIGICVADTMIAADAFGLKGGYTPVWIMLVYLFGAYIRKYNVQQKTTASKSLLGFFAMVTVTFISKLAIHFLTKSIFGQVRFDDVFIGNTSITILWASIFLFLFCLNIKIGSVSSKLIGFFSPVTLGVYLIHVHPLVFEFVIQNAFVSFANKPFAVMLLCVLVTTLVIFAICAAIELLRIQLFKWIRVGKLCESIGNQLNAFYLKVFPE